MTPEALPTRGRGRPRAFTLNLAEALLGRQCPHEGRRVAPTYCRLCANSAAHVLLRQRRPERLEHEKAAIEQVRALRKELTTWTVAC